MKIEFYKFEKNIFNKFIFKNKKNEKSKSNKHNKCNGEKT